MKSTQAELDTIMKSEVATLKGTQWGEMVVNINRFEPERICHRSSLRSRPVHAPYRTGAT